MIHRYLVQEKEDELRSTKEIYVIIDRKTGEAGFGSKMAALWNLTTKKQHKVMRID